MSLVLLFFCGILIFIVILATLVIFSSIKLNVKKCYISNIENGRKKTKVDKDFDMYIEFYLLGLIKIFKIKITKKLLSKIKVKDEYKKIENDVKIIKSVHPLEIIKKLKLKIEKANIYLNFGTEDVMVTVYLVTIISSILRSNIWNNRPKEV